MSDIRSRVSSPGIAGRRASLRRRSRCARLCAPAMAFAPRHLADVRRDAAAAPLHARRSRRTRPKAGIRSTPRAEHRRFVDPVDAAQPRVMPRARRRAGRRGRQGERDQALLDQVVEALADDRRVDRERIAGICARPCCSSSRDGRRSRRRARHARRAAIDSAAGLLADGAESALLRVHPDDVALLEGKLPATIFAVGDSDVARGGFVLESASTIVEDGPELWLEQLGAGDRSRRRACPTDAEPLHRRLSRQARRCRFRARAQGLGAARLLRRAADGGGRAIAAGRHGLPGRRRDRARSKPK